MSNSSKRPNILFLLTDDQRYGTIHALGNDEISTPNLDMLVHRGMAFTNAHIPGGTTSAVCMPSRAMLNSGRTLFHLEDCGKNIPSGEVTLGECLRGAGYHSIGIGKWHNGVESYARSFDDGAEIFFGGMWDHWNVPVNDYHADGEYSHEIAFTPNFTANEIPVKVRAEKISAGVHSTELFTAAAVDQIENYTSDAPMFMYLSFLAPHDPRTMPEKYRNMYDPEKITLPPNFAEMPAFSYGWAARGRDENTETYPRRPERVRQHIADYYAMISHIDDCIGRVIDALRRRGMLDNTLIVMCGDNGLAIGQHGLMGKQNVYEHSIRVPLLMSGPGIPADVISDDPVYLLDIYPTLCDICGIDIPSSVEGRSFARTITHGESSPREALYIAFQARIRGVIVGNYKLIEFRSRELKLTQIFDLAADPWEKNNLFGAPGYDGLSDMLHAELFRLRDEWEDEKNEYGRLYWEQWRRYEAAELDGVPGPMGASMTAQVGSWGTDMKKK